MQMVTHTSISPLYLARFPGSSSAQQLQYVLSIPVCNAFWDVGSYQTLMNCILMSIFAVDVGSYPTLVNLAYYCGSCFHLSLVCKCQLKSLELSFPSSIAQLPVHKTTLKTFQSITLYEAAHLYLISDTENSVNFYAQISS